MSDKPSNVVQLNPPKKGDTVFMMCPCKTEGVPLIAVVIMADAPIICSLMCPECEAEFPVINGLVHNE